MANLYKMTINGLKGLNSVNYLSILSLTVVRLLNRDHLK